MTTSQTVVPAPREDMGDVVDRRTLSLIEEYARLTGSMITRLQPGLMRLELVGSEARHFGGRATHLLALNVATMQLHPEAELPVVGGSFWNGLVEAVRMRGGRHVEGALPVTVTSADTTPDVAVREAVVEMQSQVVETHGVVRLAVKLTLAAGTVIEEEVVESDALDLVTGQPVPAAVSAAFDLPARESGAPDPPHAPSNIVDRMAPALVRSLEARVEQRVLTLGERSNHELHQELARIDRYYQTLHTEVERERGRGSAALRTIEQEHEKRRKEEIARHQVRVDVHPLQALERGVAVQRVTWTLTSSSGVSGLVHAQRYLTGDGTWGIHCDRCGEAPEWLTVCRGGHAVGGECVERCSVCGQLFCADHGFDACAIDGAPMCSADAEECFSCGRVHCTGHRARCDDGGHDACVDCVNACAICARAVCTKHAVVTDAASSRGPRALCSTCVTYCEGATSEPIGRDEAATCGTCGRDICERHQVACVVDKQPHCSSHMVRADRSRRFMCETHRASCDFEPDLIFASDEVNGCVECGKASCNRHGAACHEDQRWHCAEHLAPLNDLVGTVACAEHRTTCHIDGRTFSKSGTTPCAICGGATCRGHLSACDWCGTPVCAKDLRGKRCVTCGRLTATDDPPDEVLTAASGLTTGRVRGWYVARDGARYVAQLDLGWTRRVVFSVWHGSTTATGIMKHSLLGSSKRSAP